MSEEVVANIADYRRRAKKRVEGIDPFKLIESYDPNGFYFGGVDKKGHQRQVRVSFPPNVVGAMENLVATKAFPYKSVADIIRDATIHHMMFIADQINNTAIQQVVKTAIARSNLEYKKNKMMESAQLVEDLREIGRAAVQSRDWTTLSEIIDDGSLFVDDMHEPYLSQLSDMLKDYRRELNSHK